MILSIYHRITRNKRNIVRCPRCKRDFKLHINYTLYSNYSGDNKIVSYYLNCPDCLNISDVTIVVR